ncbi:MULTISPECIES: hypothetical protein [unclassified Bradyrhizobium]|nr:MULTISPECIES: hypothetical protein [unclassified Bradyrhizobium]
MRTRATTRPCNILERRPWSGEHDPLSGEVLRDSSVTLAAAAE